MSDDAEAYAQTGHTPGPWTILGENLDCEIEIVAGGNTVCIVLPDDGTMAAWADARLIAAAPEMAAEIARLREALENIAWATPEKTAFDGDKLWSVMQATARAALGGKP